MIYDMQQTLIVACFPAFPLKNLIQAIPYTVQLNSSSQNLLVCGLLQIILTSFFKSNSHDLLSVLLLLHKKEK